MNEAIQRFDKAGSGSPKQYSQTSEEVISSAGSIAFLSALTGSSSTESLSNSAKRRSSAYSAFVLAHLLPSARPFVISSRSDASFDARSRSIAESVMAILLTAAQRR